MSIPLIEQAQRHPDRSALAMDGQQHTYRELLQRSHRLALALLDGSEHLAEGRVAFLIPPGFDYVAYQWGIWRAGGVAVPLCTSHPAPELDYVLGDSGATIVVAAPSFAPLLQPLAERRGLRFVLTSDPSLPSQDPLPEVDPGQRAMILYTSGTTSKPKGVVSSHSIIAAQVTSLVRAWEWQADDRILHVLPLHHIHGIINVLTCALWAGACCEFLAKFEAEAVWQRFSQITLFMGVPTIYSKLIAAWEAAPAPQQRAYSTACRNLRLMVSGSAALPVSVLERWQAISGHILLERYGMTEIGMGLSNPLRGCRRPGHVGSPLPGVEVRLVDEGGEPVTAGQIGEIEVRGSTVFLEYWNRPEVTAQAFRDGWFRTGDLAVLQEGSYRIVGRQSVDLIKTGGYKVSALEIEEVLRQHPDIRDCAVVGLPDPEWGERVAAAVIWAESELSLAELRAWAKDRLAAYKVPTRLLACPELPRNAMGKVIKPEVIRAFSTVAVGNI